MHGGTRVLCASARVPYRQTKTPETAHEISGHHPKMNKKKRCVLTYVQNEKKKKRRRSIDLFKSTSAPLVLINTYHSYVEGSSETVKN